MKRFFMWTIIAMVLTFSISMVGCTGETPSIVRIHIRANSNSVDDQAIKLVVRDNVINFIREKIAHRDTSKEVLSTLESNLKGIEDIADGVLMENGYNYLSSASIDYEYFPSRDYDGITFPADYYNALILRLGTGTGDNWWCVAYPPLCFVGESSTSEKVEYRSKILDWLKNL